MFSFRMDRCTNCGSRDIFIANDSLRVIKIDPYGRFLVETLISFSTQDDMKKETGHWYDRLHEYGNQWFYCNDCHSWIAVKEYTLPVLGYIRIPGDIIVRSDEEPAGVFCPSCYHPLRIVMPTMATFYATENGDIGSLVIVDDYEREHIEQNADDSDAYFECVSCHKKFARNKFEKVVQESWKPGEYR